jgi:hypothetical protein
MKKALLNELTSKQFCYPIIKRKYTENIFFFRILSNLLVSFNTQGNGSSVFVIFANYLQYFFLTTLQTKEFSLYSTSYILDTSRRE